jgi:hypothetical protein
MTFIPKTDWQQGDVVTEADMIRIEQGIAEALPKDGSAPVTGPLTHNQEAPAAGQVRAYWTLQQAEADKIRAAMDSAGNLIFQRWNGAGWFDLLKLPLAGGTLAANVDQVDGFHAGTAGGVEANSLAVTGADGRVGDSKKLEGQTLAQVKAFATVMAAAL